MNSHSEEQGPQFLAISIQGHFLLIGDWYRFRSFERD